MVIEIIALVLSFILSPLVGHLLAMIVAAPLNILPERLHAVREFLSAVIEGIVVALVGFGVYYLLGAALWLPAFCPVIALGMLRNDAQRLGRARSAVHALERGDASNVPAHMHSLDQAGWEKLRVWETVRVVGHPTGIAVAALASTVW